MMECIISVAINHMSDITVYQTLPDYGQRNMTVSTRTVYSQPRNPYLAKWDILFDKKVSEWISFKPQLGLQVYPCYACRDMFGSKNSFMDHVNRRGMLLKYKCSFCVQSEELVFYNPCSFLLHTRQHFNLLGGQINLEKLEVSILPFGLAGFLPDPSVTMLYNVEADNVGETSFINTRFYSPVPESMGHPTISLVPNELLFVFSPAPNTPSISLVLKQISSNIPRCQFIALDNNRFVPIPTGLDINGKELTDSENNNNDTLTIKEEPQEIVDEADPPYSGPIITKIESIAETPDETPSQPNTTNFTQNTDNFPSCPECREVQTIPMGEHFLKTNKPFQESLKCSICKYIAPTRCSLQAHERIHESIAPYVCPECGKDFEDWKPLHAHLEEVCFHLTKQVRLRCPGKKCGKIFAQVITFSAHFIAHMQSLNRCKICNDMFVNEVDYLGHVATHDVTMLPAKVYKCSVCIDSQELYTERNYQDHIHEHATNRKQCLYVYICKHCHSYFRSTVTYATHLLRCSKLVPPTNALALPKRDLTIANEAKQKRKTNIIQVLGTCTSCKTQIKVSIQHFDKATVFCPNCKEPVNFKNTKKKNMDVLFKLHAAQSDLASTKLDSNQASAAAIGKLSCILCQEKLSVNEMTDHFTLKKCKFHNPVVVLDSRIGSSSPSPIDIKEEALSPKSDDDSKKGDSCSPKSDDSAKKKRRRTLGLSFSNKHRKLSASFSETDLSFEPEEPVPFDGTYHCKLCDYNNTNREDFHAHIVCHRDVCTSYQCMECGECFVVKPSLAKHLVYFHQVADIETYFAENNCFDRKAVKELEDVMRLAPGESKQPVAENQCRVCMQQFNDTLELNKHFRIHGMAFLMQNSK